MQYIGATSWYFVNDKSSVPLKFMDTVYKETILELQSSQSFSNLSCINIWGRHGCWAWKYDEDMEKSGASD